MTPDDSPTALVSALLEALGARAAGWWRRAGEALEQVGFAAAADMPAEVALGFAGATRSVPLDLADLGIVRAFVGGAPWVSRVEELPEDRGSGLWLRRFGARRSVAVPLAGSVVSVALGDSDLSDAEVADAVRAIAATWPGLG